MTLQQLKYIVSVADTKSMNKAANMLYISQPALSSAIKDLEEEINIDLFIRSNRGIAITPEGEDFLGYARQMVELSNMIDDRFIEKKKFKRRFSVSMQHYSFAVEAFIKLANMHHIDKYELAVHETKTSEVIDNVKTGKSELGIIYLNDFNNNAITKILNENDLEFNSLFACKIYVYLANKHPLSNKSYIEFEELSEYPCLSFDQGDKNSFYFAEEVLSTLDYNQIIKANDRATMLNLMIGLNGYTLCSGIICEDLNGDSYKAIPLKFDDVMNIGYIKRKNMPLSNLAKEYLDIIKTYEKNVLE